MTYVPAEHGHKSNPLGQSYIKCIYETKSDEIASLPIGEESKAMLRSMLVTDPYSGEEFLVLPERRIHKVFDSKLALQMILRDKDFEYARPAVAKALEASRKIGIPRSCLGIYGGIQAQLKDSAGHHNDVDLLVTGARNYVSTMGLMRLQGSHADNPKKASHRFKSKVARHRWKNAYMRIDATVGCDLRVRRDTGDRHSYLRISKSMDLATSRPIRIENALVINAQESLSCCPAYQLLTDDHRVYWVASLYYCFLGIAQLGDRVTVQGTLVSDNNILILNPDFEREYILPAQLEAGDISRQASTVQRQVSRAGR